MEKYATHSLQILAPGNKKNSEMQDYVRQFDRLLIDGKIGLDALVCDLNAKANELNEKYPRQKPLTVYNPTDAQITVRTDYDADILRLYITKLRGTYQFSEKLSDAEIDYEVEKLMLEQ